MCQKPNILILFRYVTLPATFCLRSRTRITWSPTSSATSPYPWTPYWPDEGLRSSGSPSRRKVGKATKGVCSWAFSSSRLLCSSAPTRYRVTFPCTGTAGPPCTLMRMCHSIYPGDTGNEVSICHSMLDFSLVSLLRFQNLLTPEGLKFQPASCWKDVYASLAGAQHLICITGWSVWHNLQLLRGEDQAKDSREESDRSVMLTFLQQSFPLVLQDAGRHFDRKS